VLRFKQTNSRTPLPSHGSPAPSGPGLPHDHTQILHSVGLLWASDRPVAETSIWQHTTITTDIHAPGGIRTRNPIMRETADPCPIPRSHWGRQAGPVYWNYLLSVGSLCCVFRHLISWTWQIQNLALPVTSQFVPTTPSSPPPLPGHSRFIFAKSLLGISQEYQSRRNWVVIPFKQ